MNFYRQAIPYLFFLFPFTLAAQSAVYPSGGTIYDGKMHKVEIRINPDSLASMLADSNLWTDHSYPVTFIYDDKDSIPGCGVRLRGNTSRNAQKKSFKLDLDEFSDQSYQGLKSFNLNGNHNDPSLSRSLLSANVMAASGNKCLRTNPVQLYINGVYQGVYINTEHINKKFIESRFDENKGNLYKCSWPAELGWLGSSQQAYKDIINPSPLNERAYELKTNEKADDYADLVHFIDVINNRSAAGFKEEIEKVFDVPAYLKVLAAEVLIGHWDNYYFNKNNFYLYHDMQSGRFVYLPYDMDNTFGVQWGVPDIDKRDIYNWGKMQNSKAPLTYKILAVAEYKKMYEDNLRYFCSSSFSTPRTFAFIDSLKTILNPAVMNDPYYTGIFVSDYGYTYNDFQRSFTEQVDDHATFGLKPFIQNRNVSALSQLPQVTGLDRTKEFEGRVFPNPFSDLLVIEYKGAGETSAGLYDMTGKLQLNFTSVPGTNTIDTRSLKPGFYFLIIPGSVPQKLSRQ